MQLLFLNGKYGKNKISISNQTSDFEMFVAFIWFFELTLVLVRIKKL